MPAANKRECATVLNRMKAELQDLKDKSGYHMPVIKE